MKKCPYCAEEIQDDAVKCKHCGEFLDSRQQEKPAPIVISRQQSLNQFAKNTSRVGIIGGIATVVLGLESLIEVIAYISITILMLREPYPLTYAEFTYFCIFAIVLDIVSVIFIIYFAIAAFSAFCHNKYTLHFLYAIAALGLVKFGALVFLIFTVSVVAILAKPFLLIYLFVFIPTVFHYKRRCTAGRRNNNIKSYES